MNMFYRTNIWIFFISLQLKSEVYATQLQIDEQSGFDFTEEEMSKFHIWPLGVIPYYIDDYSFDKVLRDDIRFELDLINRATGIHFTEIPLPPEDEKIRWVFFVNRKGLQGCDDIVFQNFTTEGVQKVVLGYECLEHENLPGIVLSIVGVPPQHNAPNRNDFIKIHEDNILPDKLHLFNILKDDEWLFHDVKYDVESAGHYNSHQYTSNGAATITLAQEEMSPRKLEESSHHKLSAKDVKKIKMLYNYISRKRYMPKYVEGCNKLFKPGTNISNFQIPEDNSLKPLQKPNKYLGKNDEKVEKPSTKASVKKEKIPKNKTDSEEMNDHISILTHKQKEQSILNDLDYQTSET